ncbi:MAG: DEAD/DEAH box helicase family protein [Erysipelotrichales bacterium]|nr:DEAD/DEAH box helicase family protein [Erysipelotrichales bacterium]
MEIQNEQMHKNNPLDITNLGSYLKKVHDVYSDKKSMIDIFDQFRCMSKDFQEFNNRGTKKHSYSSYNYSECSLEEQEDFVKNNLLTVECLVVNSIYEHQGFLYSWKDIYDLLLDPIYKNTEKTDRKVVFPGKSTQRPVGERSYDMWNGLQIIDIDIKDENLADELKPLIFDDLKKYNWFLGICKSASGKSLHVWTKIVPMSLNHENRKIEYLCNFRHKYSYLYIVLSKYMKRFGYDKDQIFQFMDMAMAKPQQGAFISSDERAMMNTNFIDLRLDVNFESAFDTGIESINWISHPDLKPMFSKLEWFNSDKNNDTTIDSDNISNINDRDISKSVRKHYKHAQRWQLANTLAAIYGYDKALQIMTEICAKTEYKELKGDVKTATVHNKPISLWAIKELNKNHGFNIKVKELEDYYEEDKKKLVETTEDLYKSPTAVLNANNDVIKLYLTKSQYLSHIKDEILSELTSINLLEAGAGYGKTEMIKALGGKVMLILPFTSTIKSKIEADGNTADWLSFYGTKRPEVSDLLSDKSMSMTIDKFSRLNIMELDSAEFDYIVLDESHLLFTSSYRDVMSPTIQRLANCKAKVIMMTGTPTGELLFFPNIKHIKVTKEDVREKIFEIHMCPTKTEKLVEMCKSMANDIAEGKKILFPTNRGNLYFEQIKGIVQKYLEEEHAFTREINCFYYKKSNYGDETMDSINIEKSIGNNDIVFCTTYLSVGVDICDRFTFSVYFNEQWIPQDIEQFANRLRNNDLYIKLFLHEFDEVGVPINYYYTQGLDLKFNESDILLARDLIRTCNDMIERNNEESKYNPLIQSLLSANKYLKYDENDCKYYIDETTYKLAVFEERYSLYAKQLEILSEGMKYYGYKVDVVNHTGKISDNRLEEVNEYLKSCRRIRYNYNTVQTLSLLNHINNENIDLYKEVMKGNVDILRGEEYHNDRLNYDLYVEDIEVIEKNVPIVLSLYRFYDCEVIKDIFEYCIEKKQNKINYSKLERIRRFVSIEYNRKKKRLDFPVMRFIKDSQDWAKSKILATGEEIKTFLDEYACKYANSIKDVVVEDVEYLETIRRFIENLFYVVVIKGRAKKGKYPIEPFSLLWQTKESIKDLYGNNLTKEFFLQELVDNIKDEIEEEQEENEEIPEFEHTSKIRLKDIKDTIQDIIHEGFNYKVYSELDGSNERFLTKQKKEDSIKDSIFGKILDNKSEETKKEENNLFSDDGLEMPF